MSNLSLSTGFRNALLDAGLLPLFDNGFLDIYSGTIPTDANQSEGAGTLLASVVLPASALAAAASGGSVSKDSGAWTEPDANAGGTAAWFRLYDSAHTTGASTTAVRVDGEVTLSGGGGDLILTTLTIALHDSLTIDTFSFSIPLSA
ncbi:MAG: hypothetical protein HY749_16350 [Gammaproteobacteria bacterium]|nr:hypothetical protein [Gammaproteobacteria bacterium]